MLHVDMRKGSCNLPPYLREHGLQIVEGIGYPTDIEFLGSTGLGDGTPIGIEHKSAVTGDIFTSMQDGRLTGTQLRAMVENYPWVRYLIIEGNLRRGKSGVLEIHKYDRDEGKYRWMPAYSRNGSGWTWDEFENRIESIEEFWSYPHQPGRTIVKRTYDIYESAAWVARLYRYWQKPYDQHSSAGQWDRSRRLMEMADSEKVNPLMSGGSGGRDKEISLTRQWAAALKDIGDIKSLYVERHFGVKPVQMVLASAEEWSRVEYRDKSGKKVYHFSPKTVQSIMQQIGTTEEKE